MCKVHYLHLEEGALGWFQFQVEFSEALKYYSQTLEVFFFCTPKYNHIIQVDDAISQIELSQCILHQMLECRRRVTQSEGHPGKFIETEVANCECGVLLRFWGHVDLPKSTFEIHVGEVCSSGNAHQHFLDPGERV